MGSGSSSRNTLWPVHDARLCSTAGVLKGGHPTSGGLEVAPQTSSVTSMSSRLRPLRPAAPPPQPIPDSTLVVGPVRAPKRRSHTSSACLPCRKRRRRCDGQKPCTSCVVAKRECIYPTDHRSRIYRQTLLAEHRESKTEVKTLLGAFRTTSESVAAEILRSLRSGADVSTALEAGEAVLAQPDVTLGQPLEQRYDLPRPKESPSVLSLYDLLQPFDQASCCLSSNGGNRVRWTTVTQDPEIISHLLELYFTCHHPICPVIPESLIRADMATGGLMYCSPTLMNAVFAVGCTFLGLQDDVKSGNDPWPSVEAFFNEAERLLSEHPEPRFTAVAALSLLAMVENLHLRYQRACMFSSRASCMALFLGLHRGRVSEKEQIMTEADKLTLAAVQQQLFWVCLQVDQMASINAGWQPQIVVDHVEIRRPSTHTGTATHLCTPSPTSLNCGDPRGCWFYLADLAKIVHTTRLPPRSLSSAHKKINIEHWESRYRVWYNHLPAALAISDPASAHVIVVHMWYHDSLIQSFRPVMALGLADRSLTASRICQDAARAITDLFSQYRRSFGLKGINAMICQALLDAYRVHLGCFPSTMKDILTVVQAFQELSKRQPWAHTWLESLEYQTLHSPAAESATLAEVFGRHVTMVETIPVQECAGAVPSISYDCDMAKTNSNVNVAPSDAETAAPCRTLREEEDYFFSPFARR
ncbi:uncharacterized protein Z519_01026 [Cladophialophora bantiana CBS 173.52]|uniref:Zn(2)-C6 fungal-type domain-containing protein n=1 Tax=Cladophialophora bantiana (strain ATCC 10958 / CBS 173.52 / CDC B-1940 / NIH 8579) TaxID=1442370 RepID=A0A0D2GGG8_CLAB1|nr:uncharacterized protein Z519_01026 [Cladophialophora bantiana CBS 173.52]KIW97442.1 hypothetical protein Z519_01026 [Cladophialophora bantiana CBS 173.52]